MDKHQIALSQEIEQLKQEIEQLKLENLQLQQQLHSFRTLFQKLLFLGEAINN